MRYLSICSGIEAATVAWHSLGWTPVAFSEIEAFPSAVLAHQYPAVPNLGDMTKINGKSLKDKVDLVVGGTPCQAFSIAGLRNSLADDRGNLSLKFVELCNDISPKFVLWENVPGVLNTPDNAFGCFLAGLAGEDQPLIPPGGKWTHAGYVLGPKRSIAWRVLDAQYFGLAQRRKRVFVVACPNDGADPRQILFEFDGLRRDSAPIREPGQGTTGDFALGVALRGREGGATAELTGDIAGCLRASTGGGDKPHVLEVAAYGGGNRSGPIDVAACLTAKGVRQDFEVETFIAQIETHPIAGFDTVCATGEITHALTTANNGKGCSEDGTGRGVPTVAYRTTGNCGAWETGEKVDTLTTSTDPNNHVLVKANSRNRYSVRRLTPEECEALQGFTRGYTAIPVKKLKPSAKQNAKQTYVEIDGDVWQLASDGNRYKALGNSMAVPCMAFIGKRIAAAVQAASSSQTT